MKRVIKAAFAETDSRKSKMDSYRDLLYYIADRFRVNGPKYRGAAYPEFNLAEVNESEFGDNLRVKSYDCEVIGDGVFITWVTQEPFIDAEAPALVKEIERCIDYLYDDFCDAKGVSIPYPSVDVEIEARDGRNYGHYIASLG